MGFDGGSVYDPGPAENPQPLSYSPRESFSVKKNAAARVVSGTPEMIGERFQSFVLWIRRFFLAK